MLQVIYETCTGLKAYDSRRKNDERLVYWFFFLVKCFITTAKKVMFSSAFD